MPSRVAVLLAVAAVAALAVGSGGFSAVSADRQVRVDVVGDADAYMSLTYPDAGVSLDGATVEDTFLTVRNQFTQPVDFTVTYTVSTGDGLDGTPTSDSVTRRSVGVGEEFDVPIAVRCGASGTQYATVSFDVTADGADVFAETTDARSVEYVVDCPSVTVRFEGNGDAQVDGLSGLAGTKATVWTLESGELTAHEVDVAAGGENVRPAVGGNETIVAVTLDATDRTYVHPDLRRTDDGFVVQPAGEGDQLGSNDPADPVCPGAVDPADLAPTDDGLTCPR
ncbi:hypothetical protein EGH21_04490 [Halomicroarcula sp. F13]|uniref:DUF1102 domain-containing protein n=1 Tax=Haloarcula rubra TaxID=2487747 RepID=A0AAW4PNY4_9EURY|nr:hypothetical protein [Halomicroarcula rubra]MBX0322290.1 hypothetical protein [Halomicroarcula rubra]